MSHHKRNGRPLSRITTALHEHPPTELERELFEAICVEGHTVTQTAEKKKLTKAQIVGMLFRTRCWRERMPMPVNMRALQEMHLQRLEHQWHEAMTAWYRSGSKDVAVKVSLEEKKENASTGADGKRKVEKITKDPCGDVRYLEQARKIMAEFRNVTSEFIAEKQKESDDENETAAAKKDKEAAGEIIGQRDRQRQKKN